MRVLLTCMRCFEVDGFPTDKMSYTEYNDSGIYALTCDRGHRTAIILQAQRFEVLFEIGANAILDGYYREAIASFTAAMERFFEFAIRVLSVDIDHEELEASWRRVAKQSERQLGAFVFLWLQAFGTSPTLLSERKTQFRNDVIHKGVIASREQATDYGEAIFAVVKPLISQLQTQRGPATAGTAHNELAARVKSATMQIATVSMPTILSLTTPMSETLAQGLEELVEKVGRRPL